MEITPTRKWALRQIFYRRVLDELYLHFVKLNIRYMPIKGAYLIYAGLAEKMKERAMVDIDLLVNESDMHTVSEYLTNLENTRLIWNYKNYYIPAKTLIEYKIDSIYVSIEIHCQLNFRQRYLLPPSDLFARSQGSGSVLYLPSKEDSLLIFLCHLQSHIHVEFKKTTFDEIHVLVSQENFDWAKFWKLGNNTGLESFHYFMLTLYEKKYNNPVFAPRHYFYAVFLVKVFSYRLYSHLPRWLKRIFFDIPFVRNPVWLIIHKILRRGRVVYCL